MVPSDRSIRFFISGGAGFIGSHLVDRLVQLGRVTVCDNLSSGYLDFIRHHLGRDNFNFIQADLLDLTVTPPIQLLDIIDPFCVPLSLTVYK